MTPTHEAVLAVPRRAGVLTCQKASMQRVITGWIALDTSTAATYYNAGGDSQYARKLDYTLAAVRRRKAAVCR
ncbi:hypothetical protein [uncultured Pseudacidovorax sp.]|uniref:hypothetical protein n=1 Tax=uncultured Pseudacidovorax sp. TaxID=679313 RepID=UPI0025D50548|nr:hypothetical protein [uncultured Pseudacidovorax sp.]